MALLKAEVVYATQAGEDAVTVKLPAGATLLDAVRASGIPGRHPDVDPARLVLGVFGRVRPGTARLAEGDRVEIYRPLRVDPKEARRARAKKPRR